MRNSRLLLSDGTVLALRDRQLLRPGVPPTRLEPLEVTLLTYLGQNTGRCVDHDELDREVWMLPAPVTATDVNRQRQRIKKCVRKLREKLELAPSAPTFLVTDSGGYRLDPTGGRFGGRQPAPTGENNNLRTPRDHFVGRTRELAELEHRLRAGERPLVLRGPGGVGKSRLALHLALSLSSEFTADGGAWFCELRERRTREQVLGALSNVLPIPSLKSSSAQDAAAELGQALSNLGPTLVVMDNLEQLDAQALADLYSWAEVAPEVRFLWTSRFQLPPPAAELALTALAEAEAGELFFDRAPLELDPQQAAPLVQLLNGLPLAIELAAAGCAFAQPEALLKSLSAGDGVLERTLLGVVDWSWQLLTPEEQGALSGCAVFRGDFDLQAFSAVVAQGANPLRLLQSLEQRSLLEVDRSGLSPRLSLATEVRRYAEVRLREGDPERVEDRHRDHYLERGEALASASHLGVPEALRGLEAIALELRAVWDRYLHRSAETVASASLLLTNLWLFRGPLYDGVAQLTAALEAAGHLPVSLRTRLLVNRGAALRLLRTADAAARDFKEVLELAEHGIDDASACAALNGLGILALHGGDVSGARGHLLDALERAEASKLPAEAGRSRAVLMVLERVAGRLDEAEVHYRLGLEAATLAGDQACSRRLLGGLALLRRRQGRLDETEQAHREELLLHKAIGDRRAIANATANLGALLLDLGRLEAAEAMLPDAEALQQRLGNRTYAAIIRGNRGLAALERGALAEARALLLSALHMHEALGDHRRAKDQCDLALLALADADPGGARRHIALSREAGASPRIEGYLLALEGLLTDTPPPDLLNSAQQAMAQAKDEAGRLLVTLIRNRSSHGLTTPASVYYRVVRGLLEEAPPTRAQ